MKKIAILLLLALALGVAEAQTSRGSNAQTALVEDPDYYAPTLLSEVEADYEITPSPGTVNGVLLEAARMAMLHPGAAAWSGIKTPGGTWAVDSVRAVCHLTDGVVSGWARVMLTKWGVPLDVTTVDPEQLQRSSSEIWDVWANVRVDLEDECREGFKRVGDRLTESGTFGHWERFEVEIITAPAPPRETDGRIGLVKLPLTDGEVDFKRGRDHYVGRYRVVESSMVKIWRAP